ncbi:Upf1 [Symbiodinium sp. CCMP2456]|nr:Upf1 [Symbiodinium sp. CCMP2456]
MITAMVRKLWFFALVWGSTSEESRLMRAGPGRELAGAVSLQVLPDGSLGHKHPARQVAAVGPGHREDALQQTAAVLHHRVTHPSHPRREYDPRAEEKAWHELEDKGTMGDMEDLPLVSGPHDSWEGSSSRLKPHSFDWELPSEKWTSALSSPEGDLAPGAPGVQDEAEERRTAKRLVRNVDNSLLAMVVRIGDGVGPITYSRSPGVHQSLNRELRQRLVTQDIAAVGFLLFVLGVAVWVSCLGVYQFADDPSQVLFYTDPKYAQHRVLCTSSDQESFLEAFNTQPHRATLRLIGRRSSTRTGGCCELLRGSLASALARAAGRSRRFLLPGRRRPVADADILFDVSLDLSSFISGEGQLASQDEGRKLEGHLINNNPLQVLVLRKRVLWANWEDMATNIKQKLRGMGFRGEVEVRFDSQEDLRIYRNLRWQNFVRTPITHMLSVLSGIGVLFWVPYLYCRSDVASWPEEQENATQLIQLFKEHARKKDGYLSKDEFITVLQKYPCCNSAYHTVFFDLFDRNEDGFLSESDFLGGMLAVSRRPVMFAIARPSSWAIQGGAADKIINTPTQPPNKKAKKGDGKGKEEKAEPKMANELAKNQATEEQIEGICDLLRSNKVEKALQFVQKELGDVSKSNSMSVKQLGQLVNAVGLRTPQELALKFLDALDALGLPKFPSYGAHSYFGRFARWALREFLSEAASAVDQATATPAHILERLGVCIPMMEAAPSEKSPSHVMLSPCAGLLPAGHGFQRGDWLLCTFPPTGTPGISVTTRGDVSVEAEVVNITPPPGQGILVRMVGELGKNAGEKFNKKTCRVDRVANHVTLGRQLSALVTLGGSTGEKKPEPPAEGGKKGKKGKSKESNSPAWLKDLVLAADNGLMGREAGLAAVEFQGAGISHHSPLVKECNDSQREALLAAGCRRLTLIQGPPGAGKTTTALLLVRGWTAARRGPVLCCADSNIAVDNLTAGCAKAGLRVVRIGRPEATRYDLEKFNLLEMVKDAKAQDPNAEDRGHFAHQRAILEDAEVVCSTCAGADHPVLQGKEFGCVLIDEAGQTTELAVLVPLMKMRSDGVVTLVGDHRQLPPTISNVDVDVEGLGTSLFERLSSHGVEPFMLDVQYRMHPAIAAYPAVASYNGKLRSGVSGAMRKAPQGIAWPLPEAPVTFLPVEGKEKSEGTSWFNETEVEAVEALLGSALAWNDIAPTEIGVITPYAAQARLIRRRLGCPPPGKRAAAGAVGVALVEVSSVDGFQGREKDLIIVSTVRANTSGKVGFLGDPRRLNVTITRSRRGLVVVGHFDTLAADEHTWRPWLTWAQERGLVAGSEASNPTAVGALKQLELLTEDQLLKALDATYTTQKQCPLTPHKLESPSGQLRMQFIFLYYDQNRNGRLEVEEVAKMIEHIQQLRGESHADALANAKALVSYYSASFGSFGFAAFYDAAQNRMLNGTSPLLRTQQDLLEVMKQHSQRSGPAGSDELASLSSIAGPTPAKVAGASNGSMPSLPSKAVATRSQRGASSEWRWGEQGGVQALALRVVRNLMDMSNEKNQPMAEWRYNLQLVSTREFYLLCDTVVELLRQEDSLVEVRFPCRVYGDIHGQLLDLLEFFNAFSWPDKRRGDIFSMNYVFLGDFVDRGAYSCDVVSLLFSLKILYPQRVFLIRGNHEDRLMNVNYGFHADCTRKFGRDGDGIWERVNDVFEFLPIAALVEGAILCIHGGIGDSITQLDDLRGIPKPIQVVGEINERTTRRDRMVLDALWSDPTDNDQVLGVHVSPRGKNTCRFGPDRVQDFNRRNSLKLIIRAHECVQHGYEYFAGGQLLTVFSATNYCNQHDNDGAMVVLVKDDRTGEVVEHAQVIKSGTVDTSYGWNDQQFRAPSPMRRTGHGH